MALNKVNYVDNQTIITAQNLNNIQDNIIQNAELIKKATPRNLIINSDFTNPVNQKGQNSYNTNNYSIDKWINDGTGTLQLTNTGIKIIPASDNYYSGMFQSFRNSSMLKGKRMTFAVKTVEYGISIMNFVFGENKWEYINNKFFHLIHYNTDTLFIRVEETQTPVTVIWAALYEGEYTLDTLPEYQPKGYENELLVCRQYDPLTGEYIGLRKFGQPHNLLDNSDFTNPVNQRNLIYITQKNEFFIDRWRFDYIDNGSGSAGYDATNKVVWLQNTANQGETALYHGIELDKFQVGKQYTVYFKCKTIAKFRLGIYGLNNTGLSCVLATANETTNANGIFVHSFTCPAITSDTIQIWLCVYAPANTTVHFMNAALYEGEYTLDTLPEYQPKGYGAELAECQRYYQNYPNDVFWFTVCPDNITRFTFLFHTPMRIAPTLNYTFTTGNGSQQHILQRTTPNGFCMDAELAGTWGHLTNLEATADL